MGFQVVVGSGPVGSAVSAQLLAQGQQVRVITRTGKGIDGVEKVAADASDAQRLTELTVSAQTIFNCVNPPYHRWPQQWPPIAAALLAAAQTNNALLATTGNLYPYGPVSGPMTEGLADQSTGTKGRVRAQMWADALAAHQAGRVRAFEARGSDYLGGNSLLEMLIAPALRKGRTAYLPADLDAPRTFTDVRDMAAMLVAGASDERAWGRIWHVPSPEPISMRELTALAARQLGAQPKVRSVPYSVLWSAGVFSPMLRELRETQHQFRAPFVLDSTAAQHTFGLTPHSTADSVAYDLAR